MTIIFHQSITYIILAIKTETDIIIILYFIYFHMNHYN